MASLDVALKKKKVVERTSGPQFYRSTQFSANVGVYKVCVVVLPHPVSAYTAYQACFFGQPNHWQIVEEVLEDRFLETV